MSSNFAPGRLRFLDALRGIAVLLVMFEHFAHGEFALVAWVDKNIIQIGQAGVSIFFLISGYIIPRSLSSSGGLKGFWLHRLFRLYPAYWLSIVVALLCSSYSIFNIPHNVNGGVVLWNITMLQGFLGVIYIIPVYWSLKFEMAFYILMSLIFLVGFMRRPFLLFLLYSLIVFAVAAIMRLSFDKYFSYGIFHINLMLGGWVLGEWNAGRVNFRNAMFTICVLIFTAIVSAFSAFHGRVDEAGVGTLSFIPMVMAWVVSIVIFSLALGGSKVIVWPKWLAWVGVVSYSAYLFHPLVQSVIYRSLDVTGFVAVAFCFVFSFFGAWIVYIYVECRMVSLGRRIGASLSLVPAR